VFSGKKAWKALLDAIEEYFTLSHQPIPIVRVNQTKVPPVFLQRPRHSITVIGIERLWDGKRRLLTFDPGYRPPGALRKASNAGYSQLSARLILWRYRKDETYLKRYQSFEALFLNSPLYDAVSF